MLPIAGLSWRITRLVKTSSGIQMTACRGDLVAVVIVPERKPGEPLPVWTIRLVRLLKASAYDPSEERSLET